jgi:hypothetical protein
VSDWSDFDVVDGARRQNKSLSQGRLFHSGMKFHSLSDKTPSVSPVKRRCIVSLTMICFSPAESSNDPVSVLAGAAYGIFVFRHLE